MPNAVPERVRSSQRPRASTDLSDKGSNGMNPLARRHASQCADSPMVVIFCRHLGGYGGEENHMMCVLDALKGIPTKVFVQKTLFDYGMLPEPRADLSIDRFEPRPFLRFLKRNAERIEILIRVSPDPFEGERRIFRHLRALPFPKAIVPAGNDISRVVDHFDYILWEADNADDFGFGDHKKNVLLRPPALHRTMLVKPPPLAASAPYFLTVFNPYNHVLKGTDLLYAVISRTDKTFVWCSQDPSAEPKEYPWLHKVSCSRNLLSALMRNCRAYVSFSHSEGFGWSLFEAMVHRRPIISRPVGVAREYRDSIYTYETVDDLVDTLNHFNGPLSVDYDLSRYEPRLYREKLLSIMRTD